MSHETPRPLSQLMFSWIRGHDFNHKDYSYNLFNIRELFKASTFLRSEIIQNFRGSKTVFEITLL